MAPPKRGSPVPLIIFIVLFVFSSVGFALLFIELSNARNLMNEGFTGQEKDVVNWLNTYARGGGLKRALEKADRKVLRLTIRLGKYAEVTGDVDPAKLEKDLRGRLLKLEQAEGKPSSAPSKTLVGLIHVLEKEKLRLADQLDELRNAHDSERTKLLGRLRTEETQVTEKQAAIDQRDTEIERVKEAIAEHRTAAEQEAAERDAALKDARDQYHKMVEEKDGIIIRREEEIKELRRRLTEIAKGKAFEGKSATFEREREPADGKVILVDKETGVIIDIGRKKGVRRELRFEVYTQKADGRRLKRGEIEIKTVFPEISRAILVGGGNPVNTIYNGDIIINPAFDPGRARIFVADTGFDAAKKQALREALAEYGSVLEEELTIRTDYLIIGTQQGKYVDRAQKLGVVIIREDELNTFLGR